MTYLILGIIIIASILFLALPFIKGQPASSHLMADDFKDEYNEEKENMTDHVQSIKLALRDLDLENKIGKIDPADFETLKNELLNEWKETESKLGRLK